MPHVYSLWKLQIALAIVIFSSSVFAQSNSDGRVVRLLNPYNMNLPALEIIPTNGSEYNVEFHNEASFPPGTRFVYLERGGLTEYGYIENGNLVGDHSLMPIVYLHPVNASGEVDKTVILGMPANFLEFESSRKNLYEDENIRSFFESCDLDDPTYKCDPSSSPARSYTTEVFYENLADTTKTLYYISNLSSGEPEAGVPTVPSLALTAAAVDENSAATATGNAPALESGRTTLSYGVLPTTEDTAEVAADETESLVTPSPSAPVAPGTESDVAPEATVAAPLDPNNYNNDPVLRNMLEMRLTERLANPLIRTYGATDNSVFRSDTELPANTRFILVPNEDRKVVTTASGDKIYYRAVYGVTSTGQIATNSEGVRAQFFIPEAVLEYYDPETREIKPVAQDSKLVRVRPVAVAKESEAVEPAAGADETATDAPAGVAPAAEVAGSVTPVAESPEEDSSPEFTNLSMCSNRAFSRRFGVGSSCDMVEMDGFKSATQQIVRNLESNVLTNNLVIAVDSRTNSCSHISLSQTDQSGSLSTSFDEVRNALQSVPPNQRLGLAIPSAPTESKYTYSCARDKSECRFSYDHYLPETMKLASEITAPGLDPSQRQTIRVYGPDSMNRYLVLYVRGSKVLRSLVFEDNPGIIMDGTIGNILDQMEDYNDLKADAEDADGKGYVLTSTSYNLDGERVTDSERLGTPAGASLISQIKNNSAANPSAPATAKKFYKLSCSGSADVEATPRSEALSTGATE